MNYARLLSVGKIGKLELKNRIILAAMGINYAEQDGTCSERIQAYYEERARGGTGLLVMETAAVAWPAGSTDRDLVQNQRNSFLGSAHDAQCSHSPHPIYSHLPSPPLCRLQLTSP